MFLLLLIILFLMLLLLDETPINIPSGNPFYRVRKILLVFMLYNPWVEQQKILRIRKQLISLSQRYQYIDSISIFYLDLITNFWSAQPNQDLTMQLYLKRMLMISLVNMLFVAISNANIGIISQFASQHDNHWIGPLSISLIFLGSGIGALYNSYIDKYPYNRIIFTGAVGWDFFNAFSVMFLFIGFENYINAIIIVGSLICGFTVSLFYNGTFNYVNECGKRDRKSKMYFGINMCLNQSANIVGNATSALLIQPLGQKIYSFVMLAAGILISLCYLPFKGFKETETIQQKSHQSKEVQSLVSEDNIKASEVDDSTINDGQSIKRPIPILFIFIFALSGVMISFVYGQFSILFYKYYKDMSKEELNRLTFTAFMIEGCGECLGGLLLAVFSTKITNIPFTYTINGLLFAASLILLNFGFENNNVEVINGGAFFIGVADCFCFSMALAIGGHWNEKGVSLFNLGQSGTVAIISVLHIYMDFSYLTIIYGLIFMLSILPLFVYRRSIRQIHFQSK